MEEIYQMVRALREQRVSRNRNFELHRSPSAKQARRIHRFLRGVERDLGRSVDIKVSPREAGGVRIELRLPLLRAHRVIELDPHAHTLLLENDVVALRLAV